MSCVSCAQELSIEHNNQILPDRVILPCGDQFHWECITDGWSSSHSTGTAGSLDPHRCPHCGKDISTPHKQQTKKQILVSVESEGGLEQDYDLLPVILDQLRSESDPLYGEKLALFDACFSSDEHTAVQIVSRNPSLVLSEAQDPDKGWTALFFATVGGCTSLVSFLVQNGADVGHVDLSGNTALDYAIEERYQDIIPLLSQSSSHK